MSDLTWSDLPITVALEGHGEVEQVVLGPGNENKRKIGLQVHTLEHFGGNTGPWQTINTDWEHAEETWVLNARSGGLVWECIGCSSGQFARSQWPEDLRSGPKHFQLPGVFAVLE